MSKLQSGRKRQAEGRPNLSLVPPPKPKRRSRRRWKLPRALRSMRKPKYGTNPVLLRYEEELVLAAIGACEDGATIDELMDSEPDRWRRKLLWQTIQRLRKQGKLTGWRSYSPNGGKVRRFERYRLDRGRKP